MCYWKPWRRPRTKVRNLVRLGVDLEFAIKHAISRKGYWRMSRTPAMRFAMPDKWLAQQGLLSPAQLRRNLAPLWGTAWCGPACFLGMGAGAGNRPGYPISHFSYSVSGATSNPQSQARVGQESK
jgi:hypothetical protein